jgi:hypothetical protein
MDLSAGLFGIFLTLLSVILTYHWGIKPEREEKKRRAERAHAEIRRKHWENMRKRSTV